MSLYNLNQLRKQGISDFAKVIEVFDRHNLTYWLDYGTLLGAIRSGNIIAWDGEFDISIWEVDLPLLEKIIPELESIGFNVDYYSSKDFSAFMKYSKT